MEVRDTRFVKEALAVARLALEADNPIAEITGGTGSGKSTAAKRIVEVLGAKRIACWDGISRHQLLKKAAEALGIEGTGAVDRLLMDAVEEGAARRMLVVDEANKLNWRALEALRYLADECNVAVVLVGTEFYERQFTGARTRELLLQLGRRIGAKRSRMGHLDRAETYSHILKPVCGDCADKEIVTKFWHGCRKGNWGDGMELAQECRRLMAVHELPALNAAVLDAALAWTANRHAVEV
ncbi:AAA family ATPase [Gulbenkiania mobilis]|uniref:AAA domain-containing protein n=1 Tax=Gulbenkiania mobilis TaxID=397457 RepID=A0ABY2CW13_GULMO|nr:AAA domain-containing protein [Gulbenkiania mobilis]